LAAAEDKQREAILADMNQAMRDYAGDQGFVFPIEAHLARAAA
jgi:hypothetical protein